MQWTFSSVHISRTLSICLLYRTSQLTMFSLGTKICFEKVDCNWLIVRSFTNWNYKLCNTIAVLFSPCSFFAVIFGEASLLLIVWVRVLSKTHLGQKYIKIGGGDRVLIPAFLELLLPHFPLLPPNPYSPRLPPPLSSPTTKVYHGILSEVVYTCTFRFKGEGHSKKCIFLSSPQNKKFILS